MPTPARTRLDPPCVELEIVTDRQSRVTVKARIVGNINDLPAMYERLRKALEAKNFLTTQVYWGDDTYVLLSWRTDSQVEFNSLATDLTAELFKKSS